MTAPYDQLPPLDDPATLFGLQGKVIFLAGGAGGMGRRFAAMLAKAKAKVILADLNADAAKDMAAEIAEQTGGELLGLGLDSSSEASVQEAFAAGWERFSRLDGLVYNVMAKPEGYYRPFEEYPLSAWQGVIQGNLTGAFLCCREAGRRLVPQNSGSVILTASVYGVVAPDQSIYAGSTPKGNIYGGTDPLSCPAAYTASKGGIIALAKHLASLWGPKGVRVNVLTPGGVYDEQEEVFHQSYNQHTMLKRMASFDDFNGAMLYLLSDASRYVTGANLIVDGGWTAM